MENNTPMRAIRLKCLDCVNGQLYEINKCHIEKCPLWRYRTGHRPKKGDLRGLSSNLTIMDEEFDVEDEEE